MSGALEAASGPPAPTPATIITVRMDGRDYRMMRAGRVREWANAKAEQDALRTEGGQP